MSAQTFSAGVLGCGRWGSFLCWYASRLGARVIAYEPKGSPALDELRSSRRNRYLELPVDVLLTDELERAVGSADMVLAAVPTCELRALSRRLSGLDLSRKALLLCMKGVEKETGQRLSQIVSSEGVSPLATIAWLGPGHPQDFVRSVPGCMLLVGEDESTVKALSDRLSSDLIRFYRSSDMIGCETGAAAKNVVGIAAGILDGLGLSSLKGPLMARAPQEVARLVSALGGDWRSVYGLSHLGDYEATLFSRHSRNRGFGEALATGERFEGLAEGVPASGALLALARSVGVEMPITQTVVGILSGGLTPVEGVELLFMRPQKEEFPESF